MLRVRFLDFEMAAVDIFNEGLLMAPVSAIPRLLARHGLTFNDIALWEIHEAFSAQVLCHIKGLEDKDFVRGQGRGRTHIRKFPPRSNEPERGQRGPWSSLCGYRSTHFKPSRKGTRHQTKGHPRDCQYLR